MRSVTTTFGKTGLLQDADEFFLADFAITITVGFINHLLQLLVCHVLTQLLSNTLEVSERDLASLKRKTFFGFLHRVAFTLKVR